MNNFHVPVLLQEVITFLNPQKGKKYIDATIGGGGHGFEILKQGGVVLGIDVDQDAIEHVKEKLKTGEELILTQGNFRDIDTIARLHGFDKVSGILFDLGVSSHQLDNPDRGFSFLSEGPLDMRMNPSTGSGQVVRAADLVNGLTKGELYELFTKLGEEHFARTISEGIISTRRIKPVQTTKELSQIIRRAYGKHVSKIHPATRVFQALRIAVNDELNAIREALPKSIELLESKGRIVAISFHSLEDRIVKDTFNKFEKEGLGKVVTKKPVIPGSEEIETNSRSRSAKLRVFEVL